jgi:hypothetical protein
LATRGTSKTWQLHYTTVSQQGSDKESSENREGAMIITKAKSPSEQRLPMRILNLLEQYFLSGNNLFLDNDVSAIADVDERVVDAVIRVRQTVDGVDGGGVLVLVFFRHTATPKRLKNAQLFTY